MSYTTQNIGMRIRQCRIERSLTQEQLAEKINITLGLGRRSGCIFFTEEKRPLSKKNWNILKNLFKPDFSK